MKGQFFLYGRRSLPVSEKGVGCHPVGGKGDSCFPVREKLDSRLIVRGKGHGHLLDLSTPIGGGAAGWWLCSPSGRGAICPSTVS